MPKSVAPTFDPRSAAPTLFHVGGLIPGVPDRDLSGSDLARLAFLRCDRESRPSLPTDIPNADIAALADELVASGIYTPVIPAPED